MGGAGEHGGGKWGQLYLNNNKKNVKKINERMKRKATESGNFL